MVMLFLMMIINDNDDDSNRDTLQMLSLSVASYCFDFSITFMMVKNSNCVSDSSSWQPETTRQTSSDQG